MVKLDQIVNKKIKQQQQQQETNVGLGNMTFMSNAMLNATFKSKIICSQILQPLLLHPNLFLLLLYVIFYYKGKGFQLYLSIALEK